MIVSKGDGNCSDIFIQADSHATGSIGSAALGPCEASSNEIPVSTAIEELGPFRFGRSTHHFAVETRSRCGIRALEPNSGTDPMMMRRRGMTSAIAVVETR